jgi:hypothetical protein
MRIRAFPALFCLCVIARSLSGQGFPVNPITIPSGTQARIVVPASSSDYIKLTVVGASHDSLRYQLKSEPAPKALDWHGITRMDVSRGRHSNFLAGVGLGILTGALGGALAGSSGASGNDGETPSAMGALGAMMGAVGGGVLGGIIGIIVRTEKWTPVSIPRG